LRPPFVFMRARKPCVLWRRRTLGWKVRFGNGGSPQSAAFADNTRPAVHP
jgi:hypothetical protein